MACKRLGGSAEMAMASYLAPDARIESMMRDKRRVLGEEQEPSTSFESKLTMTWALFLSVQHT